MFLQAQDDPHQTVARTAQSVQEPATGWMDHGSNLYTGKKCSLLQNAKTSSVTHPASYSMDNGVLFCG